LLGKIKFNIHENERLNSLLLKIRVSNIIKVSRIIIIFFVIIERLKTISNKKILTFKK